MKIIDCIKKAAGYLGVAEDSADFLGLTRDVVAEIVSDFYPLKTIETVEAVDGIIALSKLEKPAIDVFRVLKQGESVPFVVKFDRLEVAFGGTYQVEYSFMPDMSSANCELPFGGRIDERVIARGIAAEYCILHRPTEAEMFDARYKNGLKKAIIPKKECSIRKRLWA